MKLMVWISMRHLQYKIGFYTITINKTPPPNPPFIHNLFVVNLRYIKKIPGDCPLLRILCPYSLREYSKLGYGKPFAH